MPKQKQEEHPGCAACGRTDNESGLFIWVLPNDPVPFCPGECVNGLLDAMKQAGLTKQAEELETSIAQQLAGGWRDNVQMLESSPRPNANHPKPRRQR